jgi:hypothetical protein
MKNCGTSRFHHFFVATALEQRFIVPMREETNPRFAGTVTPDDRMTGTNLYASSFSFYWESERYDICNGKHDLETGKNFFRDRKEKRPTMTTKQTSCNKQMMGMKIRRNLVENKHREKEKPKVGIPQPVYVHEGTRTARQLT